MAVSPLVSPLPPFLRSTSTTSPENSTCRVPIRRIRASILKKPSTAAHRSSPTATNLPILEVPGNYGLPFFGPVKDRFDYFYFQGNMEFFRSRVEKYGSTVFRVNLPPGPFIAENPNAVVLLDGKSFPVLFDTSKVEKKNLFTGTFMPSTKLTGGHRVLSYLDPSELNHGKLKNLLFFILKSSRDRVIPEFQAVYAELFKKLETELDSTGKAEFVEAGEIAAFNFLSRSLLGANPVHTNLGNEAPKLIGKWVLLNLHPVISLGLPMILEDLLLHNFRLPSSLVKSEYSRLYNFFNESSAKFLDEAEKLGISRDEACHNILFSICFNSFGGFKILFPNVLKHIGEAGEQLHTQLAREIRSAIKSNGGHLTIGALDQMPLTKSVVYESLRFEPPVQSQYGRAKRDLVVESHDAAYRIRSGEMLYGFQPFATRDPRIFDEADKFIADRFVGEKGEKLLKHVVWSNGPETEDPTPENKQCAGKDFVVMAARLFVVELFRRYDSFEVVVKKAAIGSFVTLTALTKASS
ncbi:PREDICTED: allene oxide synthase 1, chloroplastic-like isoform X2 [Tarenaya hassleriana]|uniref:allene oxide synthase 1, chloroplastic-like isoform X1 n=1 Tax=Tarenaya hassleriana TaxID=28532 RepID=UPI00053C79D3|nr:PREDICTED: allene oxide synthase 1, chloroplastic-like isoform X1 [Tarenaya hassleriana]XP_010547835.1 PREDICTED: allene oxide synthase 1, chloroplastic-like isoform X2 [Tarenaya hassleriana]